VYDVQLQVTARSLNSRLTMRESELLVGIIMRYCNYRNTVADG
jgi:hypothetical protein